jgi:hypothetical protein
MIEQISNNANKIKEAPPNCKFSVEEVEKVFQKLMNSNVETDATYASTLMKQGLKNFTMYY